MKLRDVLMELTDIRRVHGEDIEVDIMGPLERSTPGDTVTYPDFLIMAEPDGDGPEHFVHLRTWPY